jgi:transcriptional regulator with XRE-family HTH domain
MSVQRAAATVGPVMSIRGDQYRARRTAIGMSVSALAKLAGVDRGSLTALEEGRHVRDTTVGQIEKALSGLEHELGMDEPSVVEPVSSPEPGFIRFKVEGVYGAKALIVEGPVDNMAELEEMVDRVMRRLADGPTTE